MAILGMIVATCSWSVIGRGQVPNSRQRDPSEKDVPKKGANSPAQEAFEEARALLRAKRFAEACDKFEQSHSLEAALGTLINWATCLELQGRLATAVQTYGRVISSAEAAGDDSRKAIAEARARRLQPLLSTIEIQVPSSFGRVPQVKIDGEDVPASKLGHPLPVDGGEHEIRIELEGHVPVTSTLRVAPSHEHAVYLVPSLRPSPTGSAAASGAERPVSVEGRLWLSEGDVKVRRDNGAMQMTGGILIGMGAASLALGGYYGLSAYRLNERSKDQGCDSDNQCTSAGLETRRDAVRAGDIATVASVAGGILASSGLVLYWLGRPRVAEGARIRLGSGSSFFVDWQGRF
jgi:hypothetical protein